MNSYVFECFAEAVENVKDVTIYPPTDFAIYVKLTDLDVNSYDMTITANTALLLTNELKTIGGRYNTRASKRIAEIPSMIEVMDTPQGLPGVVFSFLTDISKVKISRYDLNLAIKLANSETSVIQFESNILESDDNIYVSHKNGMVVSDPDKINQEAQRILENKLVAAARAPWHIMTKATIN